MAITLTGKTAPSMILLKGKFGNRWEEYRAGGALKPGHALKFSGANVIVHATALGAWTRLVAVENALIGDGINVAYASGDLVACHKVQPGDRLYVRVAAAAVAIAVGDPITLHSDGTFKKSTAGTDFVVGDAAEAVDNSGGATEVFLRVDFR